MAKKRLPTDARLSEVVKVSLTRAERRALERLARREGKYLSGFLRPHLVALIHDAGIRREGGAP